MYGRFMNETLGKIHFWGTMIGAYAIFWPMHYTGMAGVPRRYYAWGASLTLSGTLRPESSSSR
jgi:cytochrome c oxidase subunit 1